MLNRHRWVVLFLVAASFACAGPDRSPHFDEAVNVRANALALRERIDALAPPVRETIRDGEDAPAAEAKLKAAQAYYDAGRYEQAAAGFEEAGTLLRGLLARADAEEARLRAVSRQREAALEKDARNPSGFEATDRTAGVGGWARAIREPTSGIEFVLIPKGNFRMGSEPGEGGDGDERPAHPVTISEPFYLARTEVTQGQWQTVMGNNPTDFKKGADYPVETVSWHDAQTFLRKLRKVPGWRFDLPTEAQWEYACRAGKATKWCFGDDEGKLGEYAWYDGNSGKSTHPVAGKKPNDFGLFDMHGNVWEWCRDWYDKDYYGKSPATDPTGPSGGKSRVVRGGSWYYPAGSSRSAYRTRGPPDRAGNDLGFRPALVTTR